MDEPVRVSKFDWERLMMVSDLPWTTRSILLALGVFMREDGSNARPGLDALVQVTRGRSVVIEHLKAAVEAGYLVVIERGGYRQSTKRATDYAATVPAAVYDRRVELLGSPPWRRAEVCPTSSQSDVQQEAGDEGPASRTFEGPMSGQSDVRGGDESPASRTFAQDEGPVLGDEGPVLGDEGPASRTPTITSNNHLQQEEITTDALFEASADQDAQSTPARGRRRKPKIDVNAPPRFDEWYREYPRKDSPAAARKAYAKALPLVGGDPQVLIDAAKRYAAQEHQTEKRFIKMPATWLNGECWLSEPVPPVSSAGTVNGHNGRRVSTQAELDEWDQFLAGRNAS
jgi:hypothetical protein